MAEALREWMAQVIAAGTERRCAFLRLREDPFFGRLPQGSAEGAIETAFAAGQQAADSIKTQFGSVPDRIASALQVKVTWSDAQLQTGKAVLFSEYGDRPPCITLYSRSIHEANDLIRDHRLSESLGVADVTPVHLTHELYHHLEAKKLTEGTRSYRIPTLNWGPIHLKTGLPSLCEIAADRFAMALLKLKVPIKAIEFLTIYQYNSEYARQLLEEMKRLPS
jgi:hypothetical protein